MLKLADIVFSLMTFDYLLYCHDGYLSVLSVPLSLLVPSLRYCVTYIIVFVCSSTWLRFLILALPGQVV